MTPNPNPTREAMNAGEMIYAHIKSEMVRMNLYGGFIPHPERAAELIDRETNLPALLKVVEAAKHLLSNQWPDGFSVNDVGLLRTALDALERQKE